MGGGGGGLFVNNVGHVRCQELSVYSYRIVHAQNENTCKYFSSSSTSSATVGFEKSTRVPGRGDEADEMSLKHSAVLVSLRK